MFAMPASLESMWMVLRHLSSGGDAWTVARPSGARVGQVSMVTVGDVRGWAYQSGPRVTMGGQAGFVTQDTWKFIAPAPTAVTLQPRDRITSRAEPALRFQIMSVDPNAGYVLCVLEEGP
jgi:hypothetical protein